MITDEGGDRNTPRGSHQARHSLEETADNIRRVRGLLQDMHDHVSGASRALSNVEHHIEHNTPADASEAMTSVARQAQQAADLGVQIATELLAAEGHITTAHQSASDMDIAEMDVSQAADTADLRARIDAYGQIVDLARPMVTAASEHLYNATGTAARASDLDRNHDSKTQRVDVAELTSDISSAEASSTHLGRAVDLADSVGRQLLTHPHLGPPIAEQLCMASGRACDDAWDRLSEHKTHHTAAPTGDPIERRSPGPRR